MSVRKTLLERLLISLTQTSPYFFKLSIPLSIYKWFVAGHMQHFSFPSSVFTSTLLAEMSLHFWHVHTSPFFFFFPSFHCHLFLLHKHLIIWRWIWVVSNLRTCSHIFNIKVWLLLVSTFWYNVTVLHHTHQCDITKNDFFALKNGNFYWGMTGI